MLSKKTVLNMIPRRLGRRLGLIGQAPLLGREGYKVVFDDHAMSVLHVSGREDECIVSFTGVGHGLGGIDLQSPEFARSEGDETKLFVIDKQRSWGNNIDWNKLRRIVGDITPNAEITTLGNSMGGFLAIFSAPILGSKQAIAFVPQWSVDSSIVPGESRWLEYRNRINTFLFPDLSDAVRSESEIFVFFGEDVEDAIHADLFREYVPNTFVLSGCGHECASYLKAKNVLYPIISACRNGDDVAALLNKANIRFSTS